jgi:hypothetical protein
MDRFPFTSLWQLTCEICHARVLVAPPVHCSSAPWVDGASVRTLPADGVPPIPRPAVLPSEMALRGRSGAACPGPFGTSRLRRSTGGAAAGCPVVVITPPTVYGPGSHAPPLVPNASARRPKIGKANRVCKHRLPPDITVHMCSIPYARSAVQRPLETAMDDESMRIVGDRSGVVPAWRS